MIGLLIIWLDNIHHIWINFSLKMRLGNLVATFYYLLVRSSHAVCHNYSCLWWHSHFLDLLLVLHMIPVVSVKMLFVQNSLLVKQPFGESMVFFLNSFSFTFASNHIQAGWPLLRLSSFLWVSSGCCDDTAPFSTTDLDQLVQQNLIVFVDCNVPFVSHELLGLLSVHTVLSHLVGDVFGFLDSFVGGGDLRHLLLMLFHLMISQEF